MMMTSPKNNEDAKPATTATTVSTIQNTNFFLLLTIGSTYNISINIFYYLNIKLVLSTLAFRYELRKYLTLLSYIYYRPGPGNSFVCTLFERLLVPILKPLCLNASKIYPLDVTLGLSQYHKKYIEEVLGSTVCDGNPT